MTAPMTPEDRLYRIVEDGLCIGCGLCQGIAGQDRVRMVKGAGGNLRPAVVGPIDDETVDRVYQVCPGTRIEGLPAPLVEAAPHKDLVWGPYHRMVLGWAGDPAVRHEGSTAGVLTALAMYLLRSGRVDFVLHVGASKADPSFGEARLSFTEAEVLEGAGSRYGPTAALLNMDAVLARDRPFALVAKPCDLAAVRNLARIDARVDRLLRYWLTPVCGGYMPPDAMARFLDDQGIAFDDVTLLRYRGRGCPGPTVVETRDGRVHEFDYLDVWGEDESAWSLPFRCKICPDGIGETADVAAADTWPNGSPDREAAKSDPGVNSLIVRTQTGAELVEAAARDGALVLGEEVGPTYMTTTQPHQVKKKYAARARWNGLAAAGRLTPQTDRLRLDALAEANGTAANTRETEGTLKRLEAGQGVEPRPRPSD